MTTETTRRAIFGGAGLAAVALAVPALAASNAAAPASVSPELKALIADAEEAMRASNAFEIDTYDRIHATATKQIAAIPHVAVDIDGDPYWTTARPNAVKVARGFVDRDPAREHPNSAKLRSLVAADLRRQREADRIKRATGLTAAYDHTNVLADAAATTEWAVARFPCNSAADLHAKLTFMTERQMDDGVMLLDFILTDATRLASKEA